LQAVFRRGGEPCLTQTRHALTGVQWPGSRLWTSGREPGAEGGGVNPALDGSACGQRRHAEGRGEAAALDSAQNGVVEDRGAEDSVRRAEGNPGGDRGHGERANIIR